MGKAGKVSAIAAVSLIGLAGLIYSGKGRNSLANPTYREVIETRPDGTAYKFTVYNFSREESTLGRVMDWAGYRPSWDVLVVEDITPTNQKITRETNPGVLMNRGTTIYYPLGTSPDKVRAVSSKYVSPRIVELNPKDSRMFRVCGANNSDLTNKLTE